MTGLIYLYEFLKILGRQVIRWLLQVVFVSAFAWLLPAVVPFTVRLVAGVLVIMVWQIASALHAEQLRTLRRAVLLRLRLVREAQSSSGSGSVS